MMYVVKSLMYQEGSGTSWIPMGLIPGTGRLDIDTEDTRNGTVRTYRLQATLSRTKRAGADDLSGDLRIRAVMDSGEDIRFGTDELPVRLSVSGTDPLGVSCAWKDAL